MRIDNCGDLDNLSINVLTGPFETRLSPPIDIIDSTLREGEQPPGIVFSPDQKFEIAQALDEVGVHRVSLGFPAVSAEEQASVTRMAKAGFKFRKGVLVRMIPSDIDIAADCGVDGVMLFIGGSDSHLFDTPRMTEDEALRKIDSSVRHAKSHGLACGFGIEDFTRAPLDRSLRLFQAAIDAGANELGLIDTLGVLTPTTTYRIVSLLVALLPIRMMVHFHNDLGLALANTLMALEAGAKAASVTVNGVGERTGNVCLEELAVVLRLKYGLDLGLRLDKLHAISQLVHRFSGTRPSEHKPIVGKWTFTHESGIHVAGLLANPETYQPFPPHIIGRHHEIVFGKHSGVQGVARLAELSGLQLSEPGRKAVLDKIKKDAAQHRRTVPEATILEWIREEIGTAVPV
jgi:isopropylmalate/homocitrate/citramalate synthase